MENQGIDTMKPLNPDHEPPAPGSTKRYDPLLDPLPQPDVVESDSETAWGLWEDLLASGGSPEEAEPHPPNFEDTEPMGGLDEPPRRKP
jgi:hypothetical protein